VRLLLDEHFSPRIALELRHRGHDVVAVRERPELRGLSDHAIFALMAAEHRAILTEDASDFIPILRAATIRGTDHFGVVLTSPKQFPRTSRAIGRFVVALDAFLAARPPDDALRRQIWWLEPAG
jgi:predicted nuclease of predicted toxin-antitoxin system